MSQKDQLTVSCPDCGCEIVLDVATGQVLLHRSAKPEPAGGQSFDDLLSGLDDSKAKADETFDREFAAYQDRDRLMEEKFREAMKRAEDEDDDKPPVRPWDLD